MGRIPLRWRPRPYFWAGQQMCAELLLTIFGKEDRRGTERRLNHGSWEAQQGLLRIQQSRPHVDSEQ